MKTIFLVLSILASTLVAQTDIAVTEDYNGWGWESIVMSNSLIKIATVPEIGARIMQYDLGEHSSIFVNEDELGKTYTPRSNSGWHNYGGYKTWPAPQDRWGWPPPPILDFGAYEASILSETDDSVSVWVKSPVEQWKTPDLRFERTATIYKGTSRVKLVQTIINEKSSPQDWSVWDVTQSIVQHGNERDFENFWVYFPIRTSGSVFGDDGVKTSNSSSAWKGEVAPGVYGVQFKPEGKKIFADSPEGWIAYVDEREGMAYVKVFDVTEGADYPDDGANNEVWISSNPLYLEVEVLSPIVDLPANGGSHTFVVDWYAAKANGPVVGVNHAGLIEFKLDYDAATNTFSAYYGVFHIGTAELTFLDESGAVISSGATYNVTPMEKLIVDEQLAIPDGAVTVEMRVMDQAGNYVGAIESVDLETLTSVKEDASHPANFVLDQNYPNPFNPMTSIAFQLQRNANVSLNIYDINGRLIESLINEAREPGIHTVSWNASDQPAGVYLAQLQAEDQVDFIKMVLVK